MWPFETTHTVAQTCGRFSRKNRTWTPPAPTLVVSVAVLDGLDINHVDHLRYNINMQTITGTCSHYLRFLQNCCVNRCVASPLYKAERS